jgi:biotin carboxyl carrier protein
MADSHQLTADADVPESVTFREVQEVIRTFRDSGWTGMTLELHGMRVVIGKDGPPREAGAAPAAAAAPSAPAPAPESQTAGSAPVAATAPAVQTAPPAPAAAGAPSGSGSTPATDTTGCVAVNSPAVGSFWVSPSPGQPPFVQVGQTVAEDEQLGIVEVMKLMNPVVSPTAGEVAAVCAANAELVEYEQVLFWIRPSDE